MKIKKKRLKYIRNYFSCRYLEFSGFRHALANSVSVTLIVPNNVLKPKPKTYVSVF